MEAEQEKARRRGQHVAAADFKFTEVKAAALTAMTDAERAEVEAIRIALSTGYAKQLQEDVAVGNEPTKLSKRKHQISSLYHQAKMHELQELEKKSQQVQSKAQTGAKYGW
jgi:proline-rich protein PRCC